MRILNLEEGKEGSGRWEVRKYLDTGGHVVT
jgi:hypothetical protein